MRFLKSNYLYLVFIYTLALLFCVIDKAYGGSCGAYIVHNESNTWTKQDQEALNRAKVGCGKYYKDQPCVKYFIKKSGGRYHVICAARKS